MMYYFLAASLPPLRLGERAQISFEEFNDLLFTNLEKSDYKKTAVLRLLFDLYNLKALFLQMPLDPRGYFDEKQLDEGLLFRNVLPAYVFDFLDRYDTLEERLQHFHALIALYFTVEIENQTGFLRNYLQFERDLRLILLAIRAKELKRDLVRELLHEDFQDPLVKYILSQKDVPQFEPPQEWRDLKEKLLSCGSDPWERYKVVAAYRFEKIEEIAATSPPFSMDAILAYMAQLLIVEDWIALDAKRGEEIFQKFKTG